LSSSRRAWLCCKAACWLRSGPLRKQRAVRRVPNAAHAAFPSRFLRKRPRPWRHPRRASPWKRISNWPPSSPFCSRPMATSLHPFPLIFLSNIFLSPFPSSCATARSSFDPFFMTRTECAHTARCFRFVQSVCGYEESFFRVFTKSDFRRAEHRSARSNAPRPFFLEIPSGQ
jgi:hypothetical protein